MIERWTRANLVEVGLIVVLCYVYAGSPTPSLNEPHYLGKAKHYWSPEWCAGDFFLESADAHEVFYWTFGWTTIFLPLPVVAWCGRLVVWSLFAFSWHALVRATTDVKWASLLSAILLLPLIHYGNLAGEWLIGGVEAKGFAYPFVFFGMAKALQRNWPLTWPLLGIAASFHILVGGWAVIACLIAWAVRRKDDQLGFAELAIWLVVGGVCALPGLIPALHLTAQATAEELREANITYAFRRLSHHLIFYRFAQWNPFRVGFDITHPLSFGLIVLAWWKINQWSMPTERLHRLKAIVLGSLVIAASGILLDVVLSPSDSLRAAVMRYYWFRLSDILVPVGISVGLVASQSDRNSNLRATLFFAVVAAAVGIGTSLGDYGFAARSTAIQQQNWKVFPDDIDLRVVDEAWLDVCHWIRSPENTPLDSVFLTPTRQQTFKWYAHRPDVVTWKDVPQDATGLNAWWERRQAIYQLGVWPWTDADKMANVVESYGVTHVVWPRDIQAESPPQHTPENVKEIYRNDLFRVFALK